MPSNLIFELFDEKQFPGLLIVNYFHRSLFFDNGMGIYGRTLISRIGHKYALMGNDNDNGMGIYGRTLISRIGHKYALKGN